MKLKLTTILYLLVSAAAAFAQGNYAVLVQESPVGAGQIKPGIGVHDFGANEVVTLTTVPKAGYHFVYWLGDVSDTTANRTMLSVDGPKIVIAVFERDSYELPNGSPAVSSGPASLTRRVDSLSSSGFSGGGGGGGNDDDDYDPPTPVDPVPEPNTIALLAIGAYIGLRKKFFK